MKRMTACLPHFMRQGLALLAGLMLSLTAMAQGNERVLSLSSGEQTTYAHPASIKRVAIGNPEIAGVSALNDRSVLVTGKKAGTTTLMVWDNAASSTPSARIELLIAPPTTAARLDADAARQHLRIEAQGTKLKLAGALGSLEAHARAVTAVSDGEPAKMAAVVDATTSGFDVQVQIDIKIVEVSRSKLMQSGVFFGRNNASRTYAVSSPGNVSGVVSSETGNYSVQSSTGFLPQSDAFNFIYGNATKGLLSALSVLEENGFAYSLAEPSLTALSGQSASFLAGGELPVPMRTGSGADGTVTVQFKEFGVRLSLTPTVLDGNRITIKVAPEVSEIDHSVAVQISGFSIPGLRVRRTETTVGVGDGESFVISGLVSRETTASVDKVPGLGNLPILGAFFKSTRFERSDKELLMVATAHLVRPFARNAALPPLPGQAQRDYDPTFLQLLNEKGTFDTGSGFSN